MTNGILRFDNIVNFRDVGAYTSSISRTSPIAAGLLFRSARPDLASPSDISTLHSLRIRTILDLRTGSEARSVPRNSASSSFRTEHVSLVGLRLRLRLLWRLSWTDMFRASWYMLAGRQMDAVKLLGRSMGARGLSGMAIDTLEAGWAEMARVITLLADPEAWPVVVHCSQGKDRTGLVVLLLSLLVGTDVNACRADYMLSQTELQTGRDGRLEESRRHGLPDMFADCEEGWVDKVVNYIDMRWGGAEEYLYWCGVDKWEVQSLKDILVGQVKLEELE